MRLEISIFGLLIIAFYSAVVLVAVALPLRKLLGPFKWKWAVIAPPVIALLALPWAEETWIAWHFNQLCKGAGVHVARQVEVEGFYDMQGGGNSTAGPITSPQAISTFEIRGFRFYERLIGYDPKANPLYVSHVEKTDGQWRVTILKQPTARYHYKYAYQPTPFQYEEPVGWKLERMETHVIDSETGEVIGRNTLIKRRASIAERLWIRLLGSDLTMCPDPEKGSHPPFPEAVLVPVKKN